MIQSALKTFSAVFQPATGQRPPAIGHRLPPPATDTGQRDRRNRRHVVVVTGGVMQQLLVYSQALKP